MQINRLFEIVYILLNKDQVTAKELAERFEVSTRTIYRDIDTLCESGIPIYTNKGKGGGISLLDHFILNKSVLSESEQKEILVALQGLNATLFSESKEVLSKVSALFGQDEADWIEVDFGGWSHIQKEKFETIKKTVLEKNVITFDYYNARMEKLNRSVEPLQLIFKDRTWYLKAYCKVKEGIRLFKITRIKCLQVGEEHFTRCLTREVKEETFLLRNPLRSDIDIKLWIHVSQAYRVYDEFEEEQIIAHEKDGFIVRMSYPEDEWVYGYLLSYGPFLKVMEPVQLRNTIVERLSMTMKGYNQGEMPW